MKNKFFVLIISLLFINCKQNAAEGSDFKSFEAVTTTEEVSVAENVNMARLAPSGSKESELKIIREGELEFQTANLESTYDNIRKTAKNHQAIIQSDSQEKSDREIIRTLNIRVPSQHFDAFINDISKGVSYFDNKAISSKDVTEEYIDIEARLKAKKQLENRYIELLKKATKVSEMLEIETQLSAIREEIESKEGQLKFMQSRISMSVVNIRFYKPVAEESGVTVSYGTKIWNAIKSGFNGISSFLLVLLQLWPFIVILVAAIYFIRKRTKKKRN